MIMVCSNFEGKCYRSQRKGKFGRKFIRKENLKNIVAVVVTEDEHLPKVRASLGDSVSLILMC